jgi:peptidyl-prolyl cis-trans isomerase SurA
MMLRLPLLPATLLAGVALAVIPAVAQSGSSLANTTTQQVPAYSGTTIEDIIARVNDQVISKSDYERAEQQLEQEAQQSNWSQQELMEQRRDLLRSLVDKQLLLSEGKTLDITGETELVKRLDEIRKQNNLDSMEDLQKAVEAQGISYEDFKQQIRDSVITSTVISQQVGQHIQITPSEVQDYYNAHQADFQRPEQVKLSEILISTPDPDNAAQVADAEKKADDIEGRLKGGADFATVAKADSAGPTAAQGGDLGAFKPGQLPKIMEDSTFHLKPGEYTQPIRTKQGWLILQVKEHQQGGLAPLTEVQNQIQEQVGMSKMEPALRAYLTKLRDQAYLDIRPGYVDSGASPNEQKFIQGAYVPPQPKKKKKLQRVRYNGRQARGRKADTAASSPAGVPTLDKVNAQKPSTAASTAGTQKPGKKEKIRFGQAPFETLPTGDTRSVDAGATQESATQQQVAMNQPGMAPPTAAADTADTSTDAKKVKSRYSDRMKESKAKQKEQKQTDWAATHHTKFVPPTETAEQKAADARQSAALGLKGDTTKPKKPVKPAKTGPKRRLTDEEQKQQDEKNATPAPTATPAPAPAPAPTSTQTPQAAPTSTTPPAQP